MSAQDYLTNKPFNKFSMMNALEIAIAKSSSKPLMSIKMGKMSAIMARKDTPATTSTRTCFLTPREKIYQMKNISLVWIVDQTSSFNTHANKVL